jgi:hypothetical protein
MTAELRNRLSRLVAGATRTAALGAAVALSLAACGDGKDGSAGPPPRVELQGAPAATFDPSTGKTTVVVDFLVRDADGNSVDPARMNLRRLVDGREADVESVLDVRDTKLATNLRLGMVLDASYSMTTWSPPAFEPMKRAALETQQSIRRQFSDWNTGTFSSQLTWFQDAYVCEPSSASMPDSAVLDIPTPASGTFTRLFAATAQMVDRLKQQYDALPSRSEADHFSMVVFTDGKDNYSWFDTTAAPARIHPASGGSFSCTGTAAVSLDTLLEKLRAFPQLRVHVIGLGNQINAAELSAIAQTGGGRFASNPDSGEVASLFREIALEFTTVRRDGITMPLPPGEYEYVQEVSLGGAVARVRFRFRAGDVAAAVRAETIVTG